jgi:hypothetical protein
MKREKRNLHTDLEVSIGSSNVKRRDAPVRRAPVYKIPVQGESLTDRI